MLLDFYFLFLCNLFCLIIIINFVFFLLKVDVMVEKIGYVFFIFNNIVLDKIYDVVCCEIKI